ncbi:hypothetical protein ATEIFO6365_0008043700 [Aspergillus terreus]|jgi:hypothetical protein|uniref:Uncharacterized protein n=1 Tax=Aspergillus terreus TaxID=33178 RepID=A0A5M3Z6L1_ASPTE|nr:hypothetical protein ATETN484_0010044600 [Aspergillus terreus]GFF18493.1 hypothetical protein ATEIFO6365_0008043700 [Aspergillus terreus]
MPAPIETIVEPVVPVRDLQADEEYVINAFERHASHCDQCVDPLQVHKEDRSLCERGHQYALDVADYIYSKNGKAYSVVDREANQPTLVKVPRNCSAVRGLLLAIEDGLRVQRGADKAPAVQPPVISYDRTYPIAPRRPTSQQSVVCNEIIEREPRSLKPRRVIVYPSPRSSPSRGSLYDEDEAERMELHKESSRIYRRREYHR